jgi:integrase
VPTVDEFQKIVAVAPDDKKNLLLAFLHTAARKNEILSLTWDDVNLEHRKVRLWTSKRSGGKEFNIVPMSDTLYNIMLEQRKHTAFLSYVFINEATQTRYTSLGKIMRRLCIKANVAPFGFHAIRHLSASMLARAGVPLPTIQAILRHHASATTSHYLHSLEGAKVISHKLDNVFVLHENIEISPIRAEGDSKKGESQGESLVTSRNM